MSFQLFRQLVRPLAAVLQLESKKVRVEGTAECHNEAGVERRLAVQLLQTLEAESGHISTESSVTRFVFDPRTYKTYTR